MASALLLVALILFIIAAIVNPTTVPQRLIAIGLAFLAAGLGAGHMLGLG
jgi:disulfide bond formation protein DsbB